MIMTAQGGLQRNPFKDKQRWQSSKKKTDATDTVMSLWKPCRKLCRSRMRVGQIWGIGLICSVKMHMFLAASTQKQSVNVVHHDSKMLLVVCIFAGLMTFPIMCSVNVMSDLVFIDCLQLHWPKLMFVVADKVCSQKRGNGIWKKTVGLSGVGLGISSTRNGRGSSRSAVVGPFLSGCC